MCIRDRGAADDSREGAWAADWPGPRMRIGIHSGPVYFARPPGAAAPQGARPAAVGDAVAVARRLEKAAPAGSVLTSEVVREMAATPFVYASLPDTASLPSGVDNAWLVAGETDLPVQGTARVSLQCYQGPKSGERWARFTDFCIQRLRTAP